MHVCSDINIYSGQYLVWLTMINCTMVSQCSWTIFTLRCTVWSCIFFFLKVCIAIVLGHIIYKSKIPISFVLFEHLAIVYIQDNMKWKWVKYQSLRHSSRSLTPMIEGKAGQTNISALLKCLNSIKKIPILELCYQLIATVKNIETLYVLFYQTLLRPL